MTISFDGGLDVTGLVCSVVNGLGDCRRHWSGGRLSVGSGLGDGTVRGVSDL
jgi:hypothetical protein